MNLTTFQVPLIKISHINQNGKHTHGLIHVACLKFEPIQINIKQITSKIILKL